MNVIECRQEGFATKAWMKCVIAAFSGMTAIALSGQDKNVPSASGKPGGEQSAWQKRLDEMAARTERDQKASPVPLGVPPGPAPSGAPVASSSPAGMPAAAAPSATVELFEDDFDQTGVLSYAQRRMVLLVFAPQPETDTWRTASDLQGWGARVVICPVHEGAQGDRAARLAKAFAIDPATGGMVAALVRAPDGATQVKGDQLLYHVLKRYQAPRDVSDVLIAFQEGVAAYDAKKAQFAWTAVLASAPANLATPLTPVAPPASAPVPLSPSVPPPPVPNPGLPAMAEGGSAAPPPPQTPPAPPVPQKSAFEKAVQNAWQSRRPIVLIFPGPQPLDAAALEKAWADSIAPEIAPEHLVLTPGSVEGNIGGRPVIWEEFFDVGGRYPHAVMIMPEHEGPTAPTVADMSYRVLAREHGEFSPEQLATLAKKWMFEDYDAVMMRAWVLGRPLLLVFPPPDNERSLYQGMALAKLEQRVAVFLNTKDAVSGIRRKSAAQVEKDYATAGVVPSEVVLLKLVAKGVEGASARLDQIQANPTNRAFAKTTPDKIFEWIATRVPASPARPEIGN